VVSGRPSLLDKYDYVMHGTVYKVNDGDRDAEAGTRRGGLLRRTPRPPWAPRGSARSRALWGQCLQRCQAGWVQLGGGSCRAGPARRVPPHVADPPTHPGSRAAAAMPGHTLWRLQPHPCTLGAPPGLLCPPAAAWLRARLAAGHRRYEAFVSYGGLLMKLGGDPSKLKVLSVDDKIYLLMRIIGS